MTPEELTNSTTDMEAGLSRGQGEAVPRAVAVGTASVPERLLGGGGGRVGFRRGVSLIFAGWLPHDGLFGSSGVAV